jgi:hypothetical protein
MKKLDRESLRRELIRVLSQYVKDPTDALMKRRARELHMQYGNSGPVIDRHMRKAVFMLVDIGFDLPAPPKPAARDVKELVFALATKKG